MTRALRFKGRAGRVQKPPGEMNGLEREYAAHLNLRKAAGEIADWRYEPFKIKLAKLTTITVDFAVMLADGVVEFHETKGFMQEDANVKLKIVAADLWWFRFYLVKKRTKKQGGGFAVTVVGE